MLSTAVVAVALLDDVVRVKRIRVPFDLIADTKTLAVVRVNVVVVNVVVASKVTWRKRNREAEGK